MGISTPEPSPPPSPEPESELDDHEPMTACEPEDELDIPDFQAAVDTDSEDFDTAAFEDNTMFANFFESHKKLLEVR